MTWMPVENKDWTTNDPWPPTDASPYDTEYKQKMKPGNFFTLNREDHPAYDLFKALVDLGWQWDASGGRHWVRMWKDGYSDGNGYGEKRWKAKITFSLWGQGIFENENEHGRWGIGFEDYDMKTDTSIWTDALPHLATFMKTLTDHEKEIRKKLIDKNLL